MASVRGAPKILAVPPCDLASHRRCALSYEYSPRGPLPDG